ncbi:DUF2905 family protein [Billgrantia montanilacus]|uniref:DUF2905 family protein n=1 Tax=Billgrantia montanilacus TaxID=2282305 RepID=A0A368U4F5_9GAMM|nr:DUF2905 family protein [Halomonas montanilacus]
MRHDDDSFFFPITTMIRLSLLIGELLWLFNR